MERKALIERVITTMVAETSISDIAHSTSSTVADVTADLEVREDVVQPILVLAALHASDSAPTDADFDQLGWGVHSYTDGVIAGIALTIAATERESSL